MIILGIDPGSVVTGFGVVAHQNRKNKLLRSGIIRPGSDLSFSQRKMVLVYQ